MSDVAPKAPGSRQLLTTLLVAAAVILVSASAGSASPSKSSAVRVTTPDGLVVGTGCGQVPPSPIPAAVPKSFPALLRNSYLGYTGHVYPSAYRNWKPKHAPPYTVGLSFSTLNNSFASVTFNRLQRFLKQSPLVKNVIALSTKSEQDLTEHLQQYTSLVNQKPDIIIILEGLPSIGPEIDRAASAGIPTISLINDWATPNTVDLAANNSLLTAEATAVVLKNLGGNANFLYVHAIPGIPIEVAASTAYKATLAQCPNAKTVGEITGFFAPPVVKGAALQFLSTHPEPVNAVADTASMGAAALQAFVQAGRPAPALADAGAQKGTFGYWINNQSTFNKGASSVGGPTNFAYLAARVALRMLAGQGTKISDIMWTQPLVTSKNIAQYAKTSWTIDTPGTVESPFSSRMPNKVLDTWFVQTDRIKGINP